MYTYFVRVSVMCNYTILLKKRIFKNDKPTIHKNDKPERVPYTKRQCTHFPLYFSNQLVLRNQLQVRKVNLSSERVQLSIFNENT